MQKKILIQVMLALCVLFLPATAAAKGEVEQQAIQGILHYCVPVLTTLDEAQIAQIEQLPRLKPEAEAQYSKSPDARVFVLPQTDANAVLIAYSTPICDVAVKNIDPAEFIRKLDMWIKSATSFTMMANATAPNGDVSREYKNVIHNATITLTVNLRKQPAANGVQVLMATRRVGALPQ
jgi:hypothetical protein